MLNIGCHLSAANGFMQMAKDAVSINANTFQFFTRNPRGGKAKDIDEDDVKRFLQFSKEHNFTKILAHAPYTLNPCSADPRVRDFALMVMKDDMLRMEYVPGNMYNFHPGSHVGQGVDAAIEIIMGFLNQIIQPDQHTTVLLETMSGKGSEVGSKFEELRRIIDGVKLNDHLGVCLDTCHVNDAGYDVANNLEGILDEFDAVVGLDRLKAIHLNDSKNPFSSHKDRHAKIGEGTIGFDALSRVTNNPRLCHLPFYLETPNDDLSGFADEIAKLRNAYKY